MSKQRRRVLCPCGGDVFDRTYAEFTERQPIWRCDNCGAETPRTTSNRPTNKRRALTARTSIKDEWQETDAKLTALVESGTVKSGVLLVHASTFNHHLDKLLMLDKPTNFDVRYHVEQAREDLKRAKNFVTEKGDKNVQ